MKREVKAPKGAKLKAPEPPKSEIRQFGNAIEYLESLVKTVEESLKD